MGERSQCGGAAARIITACPLRLFTLLDRRDHTILAARYSPGGVAAFVVRPDGYLGFAARDELVETDLVAWVKLTFR